MSVPTRIAGAGRTADGAVVTWAVADGRKGRRWREVVARGGHVVHSLLLETDVDGRFNHMELAQADGLWTLHPESDGTLHGNHVGREGDGVRHISGRPFTPDAAVIVEGSPLSLAALVWGLAGTVGEGTAVQVPCVLIRPGGRLDQVVGLRVEHLSVRSWQVGEGSPFEIDDGGLPVLLGGETWPLQEA